VVGEVEEVHGMEKQVSKKEEKKAEVETPNLAALEAMEEVLVDVEVD
jgi:hypothetical protein